MGKGGRGKLKFYTGKGRGAEKVLAMLKVGTNNVRVVITQELEVLAIPETLY